MALAVPGEALPRPDERYHILVASPGKLRDLLNKLPERNQETTQFFEYTTYVVVDEADHLLRGEKDGDDITIQIMKQLRPDIQMLYFTATWDESLPREIGKVFKPSYGGREPWMNQVGSTGTDAFFSPTGTLFVMFFFVVAKTLLRRS